MNQHETTHAEQGATVISKQESHVGEHTPGPWEYVASNENHGPYVTSFWGSDIADCYTMSNLSDRAVCNGGTSGPIHFQHERADANARLIAAAPDMLAALKKHERILSLRTTYGAKAKPTVKELNEMLDDFRAAISKATGA